MTAAERLDEVLRYTQTNVKSLSERLGYARPQGLYDVAAGRTKSLSADLCRKIVTAFPEFNQAWLLTGEGEMLTKRDNGAVPQQAGSVDVMKIFLNMSDTLKSQQNTISVLTEMTTKRQEEISLVLTKMVSILDGMAGGPKKEKDAAG